MKRGFRNFIFLSGLSAGLLWADFSYEQTSRITGGMAAGAMKVAGVFSKQVREPMRATVAVKGDRMLHQNSSHATIIDLGKETITSIDYQRKSYSVTTFAEMQQAMEQAAQKMQQKKQENPNVDLKFKVSVDNTGQTKDINGVNAKEMILKVEMDASDAEHGQSGALVTTMDTWVAPRVEGYEEVADYYRRMLQKIHFLPGQMPMARPEMSEGMAEMTKQLSKLEGMPVYSTIRMGGTGTTAQAAQPGAQPAEQPKAQGPSAGSVIGGALGGRFGLGRKKNQQAQEQQTQPAAQPQAGDSSGLLLEMVTESTGFSASPVDPSKFDVPSGFKQVSTRANMQ